MDATVTSNDDYLEKIRKTIPAEITAIYLSVKLVASDNLIGSQSPTIDDIITYLNTMIPIIGIMLLIAVAYLYLIVKVSNFLQLGITLVSLFLWTVAMDLAYLSQAAEIYRLFWVFDFLALHNTQFYIGVLIWNFCIPMLYALQERLTPVTPAPGQ